MADQIISPNAPLPGMSGMGGVINGQDPNYIYSLMQAQRQKQIADALTTEGLSPIQYDNKGKISPLQGLAKMLDAYVGAKGARDSNHTMADLQSQAMQRMAQAYGVTGQVGGQSAPQGQPNPASMAMGQGATEQPSAPDIGGALVNQGGVGPTNANADRMTSMIANGLSAPQGGASPQGVANTPQGQWMTRGQSSMLNPSGAPSMLNFAAAMGDPAAKTALEAWLKDNGPTEAQKNSRDSLLGPGTVAEFNAKGKTPEIINAQYMGKTPTQMLTASLGADAKNAEISRDPGKMFVNGVTGSSGIVPSLPQGVNAFGVNPQTGTIASVSPVVGANPAVAATEAAKIGETIGTRKNPDGTESQGRISDLWPNATQQNGVMQQGNVQPSPAVLQTIKDDAAKNGIAAPVVNLNAPGGGTAYPQGQAPAGRVSTGANPVTQTGLTNQQNDMAAKWKPLNEAVSNAATINSRLDTIKDLATKASTGQFADRLQFVNSLLSMAGSEKATDYITAKALLDKNSAQIVAQLGQGGLATDAARSIIGSAYPNSHMPQGAIEEASNNLKAANTMQIAKAKVLMPHYLANDPAAYQQREQEFNQVADPRIFQWYGMKDNPKAQAAFASTLMKQDPSIVGRIHALEGMGALK